MMDSPLPNGPVAVVGAGAWGTALAIHLGRDLPVRLWARAEDQPSRLAELRENPDFLPGFSFPEHLSVHGDLAEAFDGARMALLTVPTQFLRGFLDRYRHLTWPPGALVLAMKGIETQSLKLPSDLLGEVMGVAAFRRVVALSGPSFALEVARGEPTAVVAAGIDETLAREVQRILSRRNLRLYTSPDVIGVQIGGAMKNVVALAAGIADGLGFGFNAGAALITRALAEITRLGVLLGARRDTFQGLAGLGDLVLTCTGTLSRNRQVGRLLGKGESLAAILAGLHSVAEGVETTRAAHSLALREGVDMPIVAQVYAILFQGRAPRAALEELLARPLKAEPERDSR